MGTNIQLVETESTYKRVRGKMINTICPCKNDIDNEDRLNVILDR